MAGSSDKVLQVELVAADRLVWSGQATMVIARTTEGELGVLPGHAPLLGQLAPGGVVTIRTESGEDLTVAEALRLAEGMEPVDGAEASVSVS